MTKRIVSSGPRQDMAKGEGKEPVGRKQLRHGRKRGRKEENRGRRFTAVTIDSFLNLLHMIFLN
jgi:hypothetical protein